MATTKGKATTTTKGAKTASKEKTMGELVSLMAEKTGLSKVQAKQFFDSQAEVLTSELKKNGSVQLPGLGKLKMGERAAREGRNPATGEPLKIKASKTVRLAAGKKFKESIQ